MVSIDYCSGRTRCFGLDPIAGSEGRLSFVRRIALDMSTDFFHSQFGRCHLCDCWMYTLEAYPDLCHVDRLPLLECIPLLQYIYLDFFNLLFTDQEVREVILPYIT